MKSPSATLTLNQVGPRLDVELNRPGALNALDDEMTAALKQLFLDLDQNDEVRVVTLRGAGRSFCSGLDLNSHQTARFLDANVNVAWRVQRNIRDIVLAMRRCPQPIVALVHGSASGGGLVLALAADLRFASSNAKFNAAFIRIGLGGADIGASYLLPRLVGSAAASSILLTGQTFGADHALRIGLISAIADTSGLDAVAEPTIAAMLATAPLALRMTKEVLNMNLDAQSLEAAMALEDRNQILLGRTEDFTEGVNAFREKRSPRFQGR